MKKNITGILEHICLNLAASGKAYKDYLDNGKTFFYAKELMRYNSAIRSSLAENKAAFPAPLQKDADELLFHYHAWTDKWLELERTLNPADTDLFVFQNNHTFPRQAARNLEQMLGDLKKEE